MSDTLNRKRLGAFRAAALPAAIIVGAGIVLGGCSRDKDVDITTLQYEADPPQQVYDEALANINAGKVSEALRKFKAVQDQNPLSDYARQAIAGKACFLENGITPQLPDTHARAVESVDPHHGAVLRVELEVPEAAAFEAARHVGNAPREPQHRTGGGHKQEGGRIKTCS